MLIEEGRICIKKFGRDAGQRAVILKAIDQNFVSIATHSRPKERRCNVRHLEFLSEKIDPKDKEQLYSFSRQAFRCSVCNAKYRRVPLAGKCTKDGGRLLLTISKGSIEKYLDMAIGLAERYKLDPYIRQRLLLIKDEIAGFFEEAAKADAVSGQFNLARYM